MKKIYTILYIFLNSTALNAQNIENARVENTIKISNKENVIKELRNTAIDFYTPGSNKKGDVKLTIKRIQKNITFSITEASEQETLKYQTSGVMVDTDNPIPTGEDDQDIIESLVRFVNSPIYFKRNKENQLKGPKIPNGSPNVESMFVSKLPILNKNPFLSPLVLNFDGDAQNRVDTLISEEHNGFFVNHYTKIESGFSIEGKLIPLMNSNKENDNNYAIEAFELFEYTGVLKIDKGRILSMNLNVKLNSKLSFKGMVLRSGQLEEYKIILNNSIKEIE